MENATLLEYSVSISTVERETGLSKDTLRIWERRYGFPRPTRDSNGDRIYTLSQVQRLRLIKRLIDRGERPGKIVAKHADQLAELAAQCDPLASLDSETKHELSNYVRLIKEHNTAELRSTFKDALQRQGLQSFLADTIRPLSAYVGDAWMSGSIHIFEEHLYTEVAQNILRLAVAGDTMPLRPPKVLLTTLPNELHGLALLMVEALLVGEGVACVSLGTQLPIGEIVAAARAHRCDIVGLSFSAAYPSTKIPREVANLRLALPRQIDIWAGGEAIARLKNRLEDAAMFGTVQDAVTGLDLWRERHAD
ncbi:MAG: MerR family transcriptional regulator [Burkholderiales bacterium]